MVKTVSMIVKMHLEDCCHQCDERIFRMEETRVCFTKG